MNQELTPIFTSLLKKSFAEPEFTSLEDNQYGEFVKGFTDNFISSYKLDDADNKRYYESLAETTLGNYRKRNNIPRFVPTSQQSQELFERFPDLSLVDNIDEREKKVDEWRNKSFEKASALRPAEREDIGVYLDALSNSFIRESASELNQTNWAGDKAYRFAEAFVRPVHELIDKPGAERAWSKIAPEDPNRDEDFSSMLASGFGQAGMQILTAAGLSAAGAPESIPYVFGAMFGAQYMKDGYYNEMRRSGDEDKAWDASVSQIPAAFLETIGDVALIRGVTKTARGYGKAFASATTEAEKRAVLREALPSMGKATMDGFIAEFAVGGMGAEFASGYGMYKATGNENYLRSFGEVFKSGLAEGIVGAVTSGSVHSFTSGNVQTRLAEDISVLTGFQDIKTKQEGISDALKRRDFDKVISLTNGQFVDPSQFDAHLEASDTLRGRATDENGEPVAKPREKNDTSSRVPVSSPISSKARGKLLEESVNNDTEIAKLSALPSRTEEEEQKLKSLTERNNYVKGVIESINNKTYQNPTEIDLTFDDSNDAFYDGKESKEKPQRDGIHEVVLDNGEVLNSDGAVVYFDQKFQQDFNTAVAHYGKENVSIKRNVNGNTANIYINKDGKWIKTDAEASYGINPSKGSVPVSFIENEDSKSVKVKFHPTVKDSTILPANFTILEDTGDSVKVKHNDGRVFTFTGDRAVAAREMNAKREEKKQEKENKKKKTQENTNPGKAKDSSGNVLPSLLDDSETGQAQKPKEEKFTQKKVNQSDPMSVLVDEELKSLSNNERRKLTPGRFERQSLAEVADKGVDLWHEGKRGRVKKDATTGRFYFEADDKTQIELNGNAESSLANVNISKGGKPGSPKEKVSLSSKTEVTKPEKKQSHKTLISSLKEKLDQIHHDSIDRLSSISGIINKLISLGVEYRVMSQEEIAKEYGENNSPGFATSDGKIVFNLDALNATNKHDLLFKILAIHESAHAGIYIVAQQNPELYQAAKESVNNNPELISLAREEYGKDDNGNYRFDSMNQDGIFHETIRMIIEGRLTGRTTGLANSGPLKSFLQKLIDYIRNVMWRTSDRIVFQFVKNVEDVIGVTNSAIKIDNENITVNDIPSNIISDFVRIINGEDVDLENYKRDQLRDLADLMRIKRDRPDIKERLLSRIKEYKPISDSSNTNIINNSQPIIVGSDFFADSGKFYRVIQGDESLNDILQSGEVRTNAAEKIKSGMTLAEKMAARPTAFPSFSKGSASMSYAAENPNHSIIVTADKSLQPSTSGRHSAGKTHFPTVDGVHQKSLGNNFQVYKHIGNGEYELVFDKGMTGEIDNVPFSLATRRSFLKGLASSILLSHQANAGESLNEAMKGVGTNLSPEEEVKFQAWKAKYAPMDSGSDYDLRGAFKEGITPDGERGHFPDTYKFPNHPTFSKESKYSTPEHPGGEWGERNGRTTFTPSEWMADDASRMEDLKKYFKKVESDAELIMPGSGGKPVGSTNNNIQNSQPINLGDKFSFRLANVIRNAEDTLLGLKIANDGTLPTQSLIAKVRKSGITEFEVDSITNLINSLEDNGRVNIDELSNLVDNEPTVVINTLDFGGGPVSRRAELEHNFDTINPSWRDIVDRGNDKEINSLPASILDNIAEWMDIEETGKESATGRFDKDPYSNEVLSGAEIEPGHRLIWSGDLSLNVPLESNPIIRQKQIDNFEQVNAFAHEVKFTSQHYNRDVADNQLAFVRGGIHEYQKGNKLPDGTIAQDVTRIFEIWGVQSDWAGKGNKTGLVTEKELADAEKELLDSSEKYYKAVEDFEKTLAENKGKGIAQPSMKALNEAQDINAKAKAKFRGLQYKTLSSPLLKYWESLALKAAMNHAKKQGASNVIISDAETTMMTEGHDKMSQFADIKDTEELRDGLIKKGYLIENDSVYLNGDYVGSFYDGALTDETTKLNVDAAEIQGVVAPEPSQSNGMRAAYDERVPNGLSKLSGSKGKKVNIGEHNKGPSKVFKNPDGTPKNTNTGLMFPVNNSVELQFSQPINIGDKFSFRLANELHNADDTFLGLKIANDRTLPTQNLIAKVSKSGITEFEVYSITNLINSLDKNGRVNIDELSNLVDNEPTVVINTLNAFEDKSANIEAAQEYASLYHEAETKGYSAQEIYARTDGFDSLEESEKINISKEDQELFEKLRIAKKNQSVKNNEDIPATGRFDKDPYSNEVLSGVEIEPGHRLIWSGDLSLNIQLSNESQKSLRAINESLKNNKYIIEKSFPIEEKEGKLEEFMDKYPEPRYFVATSESSIFDENRTITVFVRDTGATEKPKFTSQHYNGDVADNQLAFVRGGIHEYQKGNVLPDGTTATETTRIFEIWEVQSDWAASSDAIYKDGVYVGAFVDGVLTDSNINLKDYDENISDNILEPKDTKEGRASLIKNGYTIEKKSPLLKYWESLALKAAINHAKKEGASNIIISDAETAMMTEGHDIVSGQWYVTPDGETEVWSGFSTLQEAEDYKREQEAIRDVKLNITGGNDAISQEKGMRAAYDERVPNGLSKLSNSKGKKVTVGEHNKGPSKVFKNPDGTPKNTNTGLMFPVNNNVELQFSQPITNEENTNEGESKPNENITEEEVIDLTSLSGESVSTVRKNQIKRINELRKRKIEAKLGPEEKSALSILKGIKALAALPDESLEKYANLMEDFIDTRSRSSDAAIERIPIEEFLSKVHELDSEAKHAWFKQQQEDFPELQGKDFDKDYNGEMDQVKAAIDFIQENDKTIGIDRVNKNREMYLDKIDALRDLIIDNIDDMKDNMLRRIDDVSFNKTDSQHLKAGTWLMQDTMDDLKQYFEDYLNSLLTIDVSQSSSKDIRKTYYSLMGVAYDGYMLSANNFISSDIMSMLQNDATPLDVFSSKNKAELVTKVMSISAQMRSTMDTKGYEILNRVAGKFRESIKKSHMFQQNALIPYQKESIDKAQERSGFHYSDTHLQKIGIYALSRRIRVSEDPKSEIERNLKQLKDSVINLSRSADKTLNNASEWYNKFIDGLFSGVLDSETPLQKLEENASIIGIDDGMKGYVNDIVSFFDHFKPIARFTTEFIYGREFKDEHNYVPSMILNLNPVSGPMQYDVDDLRFDMTSSDIAERNVNVSGLSGTYDRKAQLKQNQAMVFNINHLFSNRGRLNFLDSLSAVPRREIASIFRSGSEASKELKKFMHDEHGSKFRYHTLENAFRTMWKNEIESTQYLHEYQGFVNGILSRWAGVVLSSAYQGVGQLISNIAPFITVNIANPGKIMDMFSAFSYAAKYRAGMLTEAQSHLYERLMFDLKNRHQDQVLDTSVNLGITKDSTWQAFKASAAAQGLSKVDKFVEKAKFFQFQEADFWSGAPMMMAEYLHQERKRLGHDIKMEDLIYNDGSYFNAIDETERFIGIGNASRRGEWLTNRNSLATIVRHILTGFAGHRLNNASNAYIEFRKILSNDVSQEEKTKSAAYIGSIAVQSAVFTAAKVFVVSNLMSLISSIIKDKDDDDEELQKLLSKASKANAPEKKLIEAEISKRKEIRKTWEAINRRQDNSYLMTMNLTKDIVSNIFIWPNVAEPVADVFIYSTADAFEEKTFKEFKKKKLEELTTKMRNARNIGDSVLANRLRSEIASLSSQQAVKVTMPNQGSLVPFNGMYGGAFRNVESVFKAMRDSYLGVDEFNINDFANLATVFGWSTADILRYTRVAEDLDRAETDYREKVNPTGKNK